ncbi:MAG: chorismate mutase [Myxococcales bacterium]|nr:chorismate mutase [Myxococcales bacterium]
MTDPVAALRARIDAVDDAVLALLGERLAIARAIGQHKPTLGRDAEREAAVIARLRALDATLADAVPDIWDALFATSDAWQRRDRG